MAVIRKEVHKYTQWLSFSVDAIPYDNVVEADVEAGYVLIGETTEEGHAVADASSPIGIKLKMVKGVVTLGVNIGLPAHMDAKQVIEAVRKAANRQNLIPMLIEQRLIQYGALSQSYIQTLMAIAQREGKFTSREVAKEYFEGLRSLKYPDLAQKLIEALQSEVDEWKRLEEARPKIQVVQPTMPALVGNGNNVVNFEDHTKGKPQ